MKKTQIKITISTKGERGGGSLYNWKPPLPETKSWLRYWTSEVEQELFIPASFVSFVRIGNNCR